MKHLKTFENFDEIDTRLRHKVYQILDKDREYQKDTFKVVRGHVEFIPPYDLNYYVSNVKSNLPIEYRDENIDNIVEEYFSL